MENWREPLGNENVVKKGRPRVIRTRDWWDVDMWAGWHRIVLIYWVEIIINELG